MKVWTVLWPLVVIVSIQDVTARVKREVVSDIDPNHSSDTAECMRNEDCAPDRVCEAQHCKDPCLTVCGKNTICQITKHIPVCSCITGFIGNPIEGCQKPDCSVTNYETAVNTVKANETKYHVITSMQLNWFEAFLYCHNHYRRLAVVTSKEENDDIVEAIAQAITGDPGGTQERFWISGSDLAKEGQWVWFSTGKPILSFLGYSNWNSGEPNNVNGGENCLQYQKNGQVFNWNDDKCSYKTGFICE